MMDGSVSDHFGPGGGSDFLDPGTPADERVMSSVATTAAGLATLNNSIDAGFVIGASGTYLGWQGEMGALGLNAAGLDCFVKGLAVAIG
jgi:hypothetical protein